MMAKEKESVVLTNTNNSPGPDSSNQFRHSHAAPFRQWMRYCFIKRDWRSTVY